MCVCREMRGTATSASSTLARLSPRNDTHTSTTCAPPSTLASMTQIHPHSTVVDDVGIVLVVLVALVRVFVFVFDVVVF